jgi:4-hydroxy-L-threonine phosphate dehydrogenase PdxA
MLCGRSNEIPEGARDEVREQLFQQRIGAYASGFLEELARRRDHRLRRRVRRLGAPPIALTLGEPAGIGPETRGGGLATAGRAAPLLRCRRSRAISTIWACPSAPSPARRRRPMRRFPACRSWPTSFPAPAVPGRPDPANAAAVIAVIARAVDLVMRGEAAALTTGPIHKKALIDGAGFAYPGHTEYLAHLAGVERVVMMLAGPDLRVVPTTIHIALKDVPGALDAALCPTRSASPTPRCAAISASKAPASPWRA